MKRWIAAVALSGGLIGGGVGVPLALTAQPAFAKAEKIDEVQEWFASRGIPAEVVFHPKWKLALMSCRSTA